MPEVTIDGRVDGVDLNDAFRLVHQFERYPELAAETVKSVVVERESGNSLRCDWTVYFRSGLLRWSELDIVDHDSRRIEFHQIEGDFEVFEGSWSVEPCQAGSVRLLFVARFDFGVPSLEAIVNPVACRVLVETMEKITSALFGGQVTFQQDLGVERRVDRSAHERATVKTG